MSVDAQIARLAATQRGNVTLRQLHELAAAFGSTLCGTACAATLGARSNALAARGWVVLRFTYRRLKREPYACIAELAAVLSQRPALAA